jgi:flagellar biogenesis protein FliO
MTAVNRVPPPQPAPKPNVVKPAPNLPSPTVASDAKAGGASAQKPFLEDYEEPKRTELPLGSVLLDLFTKLIVVLGIGYVSLLALRKWMGKSGTLPPAPGRLINVLESTSLGTNRSIHLVQVGPKIILLSSSHEQITVISDIHDPEFAAQLTAPSPPPSFSSTLEHTMSRPRPGGVNDQLRGGIHHLLERVQEVRTMSERKKSGRS